MAGETETKLRIVGTDQTGEAFRSAAQNAERLNRSIAQGFQGQQALVGRLAGGVAGLERRLTAATAAMGVGAALRSSFTEFAATDRRMTRLAQNAEVSGKAVREFKQELVRMGSEIGIGTESMIAGFETYVRQTGSYEKAKANIRSIGEFAHAVGAEAREAATTARVLEQSFNIDAGTMPLAFDMIAAAANKGNYEAKDLARSIPELADAASAAGMHGAKGLSEMLAMMEAISDKVAEPQQVMQGMRDMLARMSQPEMMNNFQKETGINMEAQLNNARRSGKSVSATFVQTIDVGLRQMATRMKIPLERRQELLARLVPELDSRRAVSALLNGLPRVIEVLNATEMAAGTVRKQLKDLTNDPQANIQRLEDSWDSLKQSLGQTMVSVGLLEGLKSVREEFEGIQRAAKMLDDFMAKVRTKGVLGAVFDSGDDAVRNKELINAEELKRDAEERLKLFEGAKRDGETDASDGRRHGGLGIPGLGFLSPPIPVDHGIENARRDIAAAEERIAAVKREGAAKAEFDDRRARGIPMSEEERLRLMTNSREAPVTPLDVKPLPAERRVMAPEITVDPDLARRRAELDRLAPPGSDPAIRAAVEQMKRELIETREGGFTARRVRPEVQLTAPDYGKAPEKPEPVAPLGRPSIVLRDRAQPEPVAPARPMAPNAPAQPAQAPNFGRSERLPPGVIDPYAPPPEATVQRQSFDGDGDASWKGLIHRTALTSETTDATARGQMDQISEARRTNEILGNMLRRTTLPRNADDGMSGGGGAANGGNAGYGAGPATGGGGGGQNGRDDYGSGSLRRGTQRGGRNAGGGGGGDVGPELGRGNVRGGNRAPTTEQGKKNVASWLAYAQKPVDEGGLGLTKEQAHGMVAGMQGESGPNLNPGSYNPNDRGAPSGGTMQWRKERLDALRAFARERGDTSNNGLGSVETQQQYQRHEFLGKGGTTGGSENRAYRAIKGEQTREGALRQFVAKGERPQFPGPEIAKRSAYLYGHGDGESPPTASADGTGKPVRAEGLRTTGAQATGGGDHEEGTEAAALWAQQNMQGYRATTALNDHFHKGRPGSKHNDGLAGDLALDRNATREDYARETQRLNERFKAAGLTPGRDFRTIDEKANPSRGATGAHIHYQFQTREAARRYAEFQKRESEAARAKVADADMKEVQGPMHPDDITRRSAFAGQKDKPKRWVQDPETEKWRPDFENDGSKPGAPNPNRPINAGKGAQGPDLEAARQQVEAHRREMERPIRIRYETDSNSGNVGHRGPVQAKREQEASMRSARYGSFSDVGVA